MKEWKVSLARLLARMAGGMLMFTAGGIVSQGSMWGIFIFAIGYGLMAFLGIEPEEVA